eukprot:2480699-Heterocapsa_arctica.AAC.1
MGVPLNRQIPNHQTFPGQSNRLVPRGPKISDLKLRKNGGMEALAELRCLLPPGLFLPSQVFLRIVLAGRFPTAACANDFPDDIR